MTMSAGNCGTQRALKQMAQRMSARSRLTDVTPEIKCDFFQLLRKLPKCVASESKMKPRKAKSSRAKTAALHA